jgi:SAM-dependent methyltransferase
VSAPELAAPGGDAYEALGALYDVWCESVVEDLDFYLEVCAGADGPIVELGVGSGRVAVPLALAGHRVRGLDASPAMLALARTRAEQAGVSERVQLSLGDLSDPPASLGPATRVLVPFRPYLHLVGDGQRLRALRGARDLLAPGGRLVFDVFEPTAADIRKTHDRWLEREAGIWERARWNAAERVIELAVRTRGRVVEMRLEWCSSDEWRALCAEAGLRVVAAYRGFDGAPLDGLPGDHVFVCERDASEGP